MSAEAAIAAFEAAGCSRATAEEQVAKITAAVQRYSANAVPRARLVREAWCAGLPEGHGLEPEHWCRAVDLAFAAGEHDRASTNAVYDLKRSILNAFAAIPDSPPDGAAENEMVRILRSVDEELWSLLDWLEARTAVG